MAKSLVLGAVLGGLVVFIWSAISWMVLPWHNATLRTFTNQDQVASVLWEHVDVGGMYLLPNRPRDYGSMTAEQKREADAAMEEHMKSGTYMFGVVRRPAPISMARSMIYGLLFDILGALLICMLVLKTGGMTYGGRVMFIVTAALAVAVIGVVPNWVWWHFSTGYTLVLVLDIAIGWLLAGLVIAKVVAPKPA